jgi:hypothetical protein
MVQVAGMVYVVLVPSVDYPDDSGCQVWCMGCEIDLILFRPLDSPCPSFNLTSSCKTMMLQEEITTSVAQIGLLAVFLCLDREWNDLD